jgi:hypothetical protein
MAIIVNAQEIQYSKNWLEKVQLHFKKLRYNALLAIT